MNRPKRIDLIVNSNNGWRWFFRAFTLKPWWKYFVCLQESEEGSLDSITEEFFIADSQVEMIEMLIGFLYGNSFGAESRLCVTNNVETVTEVGFRPEGELTYTWFDRLDRDETIRVLGIGDTWNDTIDEYIAEIEESLEQI